MFGSQQSLGFALASKDWNPAGHSVHDVEALVNVENQSTLQFRHALVPVTFLYVPPTHAGQGPPSGPVYPTLQVQFTSIVFPVAGVNEFAGHTVHACGPSQSLYLPSAHSAHGPPSGPVTPGTQEQIVIAVTDD